MEVLQAEKRHCQLDDCKQLLGVTGNYSLDTDTDLKETRQTPHMTRTCLEL